MLLTELIVDKDKFFDIIKNDWLTADDSFPVFLPEISLVTKYDNEHYLKAIIAGLQKQIKKYPRWFPFRRKKWRTQTFDVLNDILYQEEILGMHHYMDREETDAFVTELKEFLRKVRSFSPELALADIGQAIRNYIVYMMFKKLHLIDTGFDLAGFGYSMLYPFTDNYIDNNSLSATDKIAFNRMIRDKIESRMVSPRSEHQKKTCRLLQYIGDLYPVNHDTPVSQLLLMMLDAQETSIRQQNRELPLTFQECLDISVYKGGISVLLDRVFVHKECTHEDIIFYLDFGFFLQLVDDLQDIREDSDLGASSIFTIDLRNSHEELTVNKLLHFLHKIMEGYTSENERLKQFLLMNSYLLIYSSVIRSKEFFSKEYLTELEQYLPVTCTYWDSLHQNRIETMDYDIQAKYIHMLDELIR
jgi:hypothetical protein